jgi:hypothetical protein
MDSSRSHEIETPTSVHPLGPFLDISGRLEPIVDRSNLFLALEQKPL